MNELNSPIKKMFLGFAANKDNLIWQNIKSFISPSP